MKSLVRLDVFPAESAFDAEMSASDGVIVGGSYLDDLFVLDMHLKIAANSAI